MIFGFLSILNQTPIPDFRKEKSLHFEKSFARKHKMKRLLFIKLGKKPLSGFGI